MDTRNVNLFVFDTPENYQKSKQFLGEEGITFKRMIRVSTFSEFQSQLNLLNMDELVAFAVHVFYTDHIRGIKSFKASGISKHYPKIQVMYISDGDSKQIRHEMLDQEIEPAEIYKYHQVQSSIGEQKIRVFSKREILENSPEFRGESTDSPQRLQSSYPQIEYAVITALYEDEFEQLKKVFDFPEAKEISTATKLYYRGYLKTNPNIEIVAAIPNATGMVDSSIIATQMLEYFKPKYLLMSGVCGSPHRQVGDIIVAKQIFTFQKGKVSDLSEVNSADEMAPIELFDKNREVVDYEHLYDYDGNQISISIEKFEIEHDAMININSLIDDKLKSKLSTIKDKIRIQIDQEGFFSEIPKPNIYIEPIACSTMVINKKGYFEDTIRSVQRKTAAVEMESYGVARACHFANEGKTIPIIFKSVMDHTHAKSDNVGALNYKKFAAYTSALFMKCLFEENII